VTGGASYHAIYLVLNEAQLFEASLRSIYPHITGATVITSHDHDRFDRPVEPDHTVPALLSRDLDPERKVNVLVCAEGDEVSLRNRAMAFALPPSRAAARHGQQPSRARIPTPDWFWIVDADEIYDDGDVHRLKAYVAEHRARAYQVTADNYWRSWNWRIEQRGSYVVIVAPGVWFGELRHPQVRPRDRVLRRLATWGVVPRDLSDRWRGIAEVPRDVAIFHHGSYLGDRDRIAAKLERSGHRDQHLADWLDRVWDGWTPDARDLHPFDPPAFPCAQHVATAQLPEAIRTTTWPDGWLEPL
jgi:hypothetical protein